MLRLEDVHAGYGPTTVLRGFNLDVADKQTVAVLGRNGVGKTTALRAITGILPLQRGTITFDGKDLSRLPVHERSRRGIAYVPQGRDIFPGLTVLDNLRVAAYGSRQQNWEEQLDAMFADFPVLAEKSNARGGSLSGGQQQILALARALMTSPRILLLDEPSEGIQPSILDQIADTLRTVNEQRGIPVLLVEQNLDFVFRLATRVHLVDKGQVVRELSTEELLGDKELQHEYLGI
ncbi:MAG: ABC transporter ATP-binding protein [Actinomycetota bacterium]|nr:ABC transporter ATP-binding protein [Actinomycetota bacterium]